MSDVKNYLAFDFGASSGRAILGKLHEGKLELEEIHRFSNDPVEINGHYYWDTFRLFYEIKQGLIKYAQGNYGPLEGIGIDAWGVDFGLIGPSGELLGVPYHYRDSRTEGMMEEADKLMGRRRIFDESGISHEFFNTVYQLLAMVKQDSPALKYAKYLLFIPDLFDYFLTGEVGTEFCEATTSQLVNPVTHTWSNEILKDLGIPSGIFTDIQYPGTLRGRLLPSIQQETGLGAVPVYAVASHDTNSASAAVPAKGDSWAFLSSGTWSLLGIEVDKPVVNDTTYNYNYTNEGAVGGRYNLLKNIMGMWIIQQLRADWERRGEKYSFGELVKLAEGAQPFKAFINPDDSLFVPPVDMDKRIMQYCERTNQQVPKTKGEILRCAYESLALKYRQAIEGLEEITGKKIDTLHIVGGGCQNAMLNQMTANSTNRRVVTGPVEGTAIGNLLVQAMAAGEIKDIQELRSVVAASFPNEIYQPEEKETWDKAYEAYKKVTI